MVDARAGRGRRQRHDPTVGTLVDGELVTEGYQPGYGILLDPSVVPLADAAFLPSSWGFSFPSAWTIRRRSRLSRRSRDQPGTDAAVIAAAQRNLTGTQSVYLIRRTYVDGTPNAGWFGLIVRPEELADRAAFTAAINDVKLGGLMWWLVESDGFVWYRSSPHLERRHDDLESDRRHSALKEDRTMPGSTSRLGLPYPLGSEDVSAYPPVSETQMTTLDAGALARRHAQCNADCEHARGGTPLLRHRRRPGA